MRLPEAGTVEIVAGQMGSGKSLHCVSRILAIIQGERRPVFTNLPVKMRVFRQYLRVKSGPAYASLIYSLTEEHFLRFIDRQHDMMKLRKRLEDKWALRRRPIMHDRVRRIFERINGASIYDGPRANDILPTAYVIIDEAHHWFPMQAGKDKDKVLQSYLTMCRHHMHQPILVSQAPMQLSTCARRLCSLYSICRNKAQDSIAWGIRFKHLGIKALGIETYRGEDIVSGEPVRGAQPMKSAALLLQSPSVRVFFRLYSSFTHLGSPRRMMNALDRVRQTHGIFDEDRSIRERAQRLRRERPMKIGKFIFRNTRRLCVFSLAVIIGVAVGRGSMPKPPVSADAAEAAVFELPEGLALKGRAGSRIAVGENWYAKGDDFYGAVVSAVARDGLLLDHGGVLYAFTRDGLQRIGPRDSVLPGNE